MKDLGLNQQELAKILSVFRSHPEIKEVIPFGSRAKGTSKPNSDIDLAVDAVISSPVRQHTWYLRWVAVTWQPIFHDIEQIKYMTISPNVIRHKAAVTRPRRETLNGHKSVNLWFTGLSGSGKSTLAHAVEERLHLQGKRTYVFDGDNVRHGLCGDLGFSMEDRRENLRRIAEMTKLFLDSGVISLTAFISPLAEGRARIREIIGPDDFIEVYCNCPLEICEQRDVKGLYKKAREGKIKNYTGVSSPYEAPVNPDIELDTGTQPLMECVNIIVDALRAKGIIF